ncbi:MAG: RNA methyltransferase [Lachnospiraceae bacterium]|nr:RNA methyltransferase [Lachnospiraceae bacterium]
MITSISNQRIKNVINLISSSKARRDQGKYIVEGQKMFLEAPSRYVEEVYVSESYEKSPEGKKVLIGKTYEIVSDTVFKKMSDTVTPQGVMCVLDKAKYSFDDLINKKSLRILVLEGVQDPGNLGTMLRTSEAAGFNFILADKNTVDVYNPKVIRSTMGSIFRIPVIYTNNLLEDIDKLKSAGVKCYAAHLKGDKNYSDVEYPEKAAVFIGNEGKGLSDEISEKADTLVKIPMAGKVESLNAAIAAALMMFETNR